MKANQTKTDVFSLAQDEWRVRIGDRVLPHTWNSKGAATAGLAVELRRMAGKQSKGVR